MKIEIENKNLNDIPVIITHKTELNKKLPVIIILHSYSGIKEDHIMESYFYAKIGYYVVGYDAYFHGDLKPITGIDYHNIDLKKVFEIYMKTFNAIDNIIEALENEEYADTKNIGLLGYSMGGNLILKYLTHCNENIKAAITCLSSPIWTNVFVNYFKKFIDSSIVSTVEIKEYLENLEPFHDLHKIKDLPLLLLNGVDDDIVPIEDVEKSYNILKDNYSSKDLIELVSYPGLKHKFVFEMLEVIKEWFNRYLK